LEQGRARSGLAGNYQFSITNKLPSYGIISQQYQSNTDVQRALQRIKETDVIDSNIASQQLFEFIRDVIVRKELNPITGEYVVTDVVVDNVQLDSEAKKILKKKIIEHCNLKLDSYKVPMKINFVENISFGERFKRKRM
jgi:hypothetical protein